jgi:hypothetical protein
MRIARTARPVCFALCRHTMWPWSARKTKMCAWRQLPLARTGAPVASVAMTLE